MKMPAKSVAQGSKLSGLLFGIYTMEISMIPKMMKNNLIFKLLTGKEINKYSGIDHKIVCYIDDVQHVIGHKSNTVLEKYINDLHKSIKYSITRHFADDTNLLLTNSSLKQLK